MRKLISIYDNYSDDCRCVPDEHSSKPEEIVILLCIQGKARFNMRFTECEMKKNTFLAIAPGIPFSLIEYSKDFRVNVITINESLLEKLAHGQIKFYFYKILYVAPLLDIPEEKMVMFEDLHYWLSKFVEEDEDNYFKTQIVLKFLDILFYEASNIMFSLPESQLNINRHKDDITGEFIKLLEQNYLKHRKVEFYAEKMNITPKYLSSTIKAATGRTASAWIDDYTLLEAQNMLQTSASTIQEISYELGFSSPSHFAKFFKDKTDMTPGEARDKSHEEKFSL